jgi:phosphatidylglycerophosphate synthase
MTYAPQAAPSVSPPRRPLRTREKPWAKALAHALTRAGVAPNAISVTSLVFAALSGFCLWSTAHAEARGRTWLLLAAAACIQLRLLCNMLDGMVAVEGGRRTPYGEIFNDMPDRFADLVILIASGYSLPFSWGRELGWLAGALALLTAYVRLLGGSMGVQQYFLGPMAKPQRMAVMTAACVLATVEPELGWRGQTVAAALVIIIAGALVTFVRRTVRIVADLRAR